MKPFFFTLDIGHYRTGEIIGKCCGVVLADDLEHAEEAAWSKYGGDSRCNLNVREITEDSTSYTVWRGTI